MILHPVAVLLVVICVLVGIFLVPLSLPGTWLIVLASVLYSLFYPFDSGNVSALWVNGVLLLVAILGEILEFFVATFGSKTLKVSTGAIVSAFVGGIVGAVVGVPVFLLGTLLGLLLGAFLGAFIYEWISFKKFGQAWVMASAVLMTRMVGSFLKTILAVGMSVYLLAKIF